MVNVDHSEISNRSEIENERRVLSIVFYSYSFLLSILFEYKCDSKCMEKAQIKHLKIDNKIVHDSFEMR